MAEVEHDGEAWEQLKAAMRTLNRRRLSARAIAKMLEKRAPKPETKPETRSHTVVSQVLTMVQGKNGVRRLPNLAGVLIVVEFLAPDGEAEVWRERIERLYAAAEAEIARRRVAEVPVSDTVPADVLLPTRRWVDYLDRSTRTGGRRSGHPEQGPAERLLRSDPEAGEALSALHAVQKLLDNGLTVAAVTDFRGLHSRITSLAELWTVILADSVLHRGNDGDHRWLARETNRILKGGDPAQAGRVRAVWTWIFDHHLRERAPRHDRTLLAALLSGAAPLDADGIDRVYELLIDIMGSDPACHGPILAALDELRQSGDLRLRKRVLRLIGVAEAKAGIRLSAGSLSLGEVVSVSASRYEFKAMTHPLTRDDVHMLETGSPADRWSDRGLYPHVFPATPDPRTDFDVLGRKVRAILDRCWSLEEDKEWRWDIPTAAEWLALAGCGPGKRFPWGNTPAEAWQANLAFPGAKVLMKPVGSLGGEAPYDCCGNVHELVRVGVGDRFPDDFRLAGGSFRTLAVKASCRHFGRLIQREGNPPPRPRGDVGLRLIRFRLADEEQRVFWPVPRRPQRG